MTHPLIEEVLEAFNSEAAEPCPYPETCKPCRAGALAAIKVVLEHEPTWAWLALLVADYPSSPRDAQTIHRTINKAILDEVER